MKVDDFVDKMYDELYKKNTLVHGNVWYKININLRTRMYNDCFLKMKEVENNVNHGKR